MNLNYSDDSLLQSMRTNLGASKTSMSNQLAMVQDIMSKSNTILLKAENSRDIRTELSPNAVHYSFRKENATNLTHILLKFTQLASGSSGQLEMEPHSSEKYQATINEQIDFLRSATRKLNALKDAADQMNSEQIAADLAATTSEDDEQNGSSESS